MLKDCIIVKSQFKITSHMHSKVCICFKFCVNLNYFMIPAFSFVIQQRLFNVQPSWIFNKLKVRGGLDNIGGKSGADELTHNYL